MSREVLRRQHGSLRDREVDARDRSRDTEPRLWPGKRALATDVEISAEDHRSLAIHRLRDVLRGLHGGGMPLPAALATRMARLLDADLADVRVHTSGPASLAAAHMGAQAFAHGSHIAFAPGVYDPDSARSRYILAHELVHVVQNRRAGGRAMELAARLDIGPSGSAIEREAERGAAALISGRAFTVSAHASLPGISLFSDHEVGQIDARLRAALDERADAGAKEQLDRGIALLREQVLRATFDPAMVRDAELEHVEDTAPAQPSDSMRAQHGRRAATSSQQPPAARSQRGPQARSLARGSRPPHMLDVLDKRPKLEVPDPTKAVDPRALAIGPSQLDQLERTKAELLEAKHAAQQRFAQTKRAASPDLAARLDKELEQATKPQRAEDREDVAERARDLPANLPARDRASADAARTLRALEEGEQRLDRAITRGKQYLAAAAPRVQQDLDRAAPLPAPVAGAADTAHADATPAGSANEVVPAARIATPAPSNALVEEASVAAPAARNALAEGTPVAVPDATNALAGRATPVATDAIVEGARVAHGAETNPLVEVAPIAAPTSATKQRVEDARVAQPASAASTLLEDARVAQPASAASTLLEDARVAQSASAASTLLEDARVAHAGAPPLAENAHVAATTSAASQLAAGARDAQAASVASPLVENARLAQPIAAPQLREDTRAVGPAATADPLVENARLAQPIAAQQLHEDARVAEPAATASSPTENTRLAQPDAAHQLREDARVAEPAATASSLVENARLAQPIAASQLLEDANVVAQTPASALVEDARLARPSAASERLEAARPAHPTGATSLLLEDARLASPADTSALTENAHVAASTAVDARIGDARAATPGAGSPLLEDARLGRAAAASAPSEGTRVISPVEQRHAEDAPASADANAEPRETAEERAKREEQARLAEAERERAAEQAEQVRNVERLERSGEQARQASIEKAAEANDAIAADARRVLDVPTGLSDPLQAAGAAVLGPRALQTRGDDEPSERDVLTARTRAAARPVAAALLGEKRAEAVDADVRVAGPHATETAGALAGGEVVAPRALGRLGDAKLRSVDPEDEHAAREMRSRVTPLVGEENAALGEAFEPLEDQAPPEPVARAGGGGVAMPKPKPPPTIPPELKSGNQRALDKYIEQARAKREAEREAVRNTQLAKCAGVTVDANAIAAQVKAKNAAKLAKIRKDAAAAKAKAEADAAAKQKQEGPVTLESLKEKLETSVAADKKQLEQTFETKKKELKARLDTQRETLEAESKKQIDNLKAEQAAKKKQAEAIWQKEKQGFTEANKNLVKKIRDQLAADEKRLKEQEPKLWEKANARMDAIRTKTKKDVEAVRQQGIKLADQAGKKAQTAAAAEHSKADAAYKRVMAERQPAYDKLEGVFERASFQAESIRLATAAAAPHKKLAKDIELKGDLNIKDINASTKKQMQEVEDAGKREVDNVNKQTAGQIDAIRKKIDGLKPLADQKIQQAEAKLEAQLQAGEDKLKKSLEASEQKIAKLRDETAKKIAKLDTDALKKLQDEYDRQLKAIDRRLETARKQLAAGNARNLEALERMVEQTCKAIDNSVATAEKRMEGHIASAEKQAQALVLAQLRKIKAEADAALQEIDKTFEQAVKMARDAVEAMHRQLEETAQGKMLEIEVHVATLYDDAGDSTRLEAVKEQLAWYIKNKQPIPKGYGEVARGEQKEQAAESFKAAEAGETSGENAKDAGKTDKDKEKKSDKKKAAGDDELSPDEIGKRVEEELQRAQTDTNVGLAHAAEHNLDTTFKRASAAVQSVAQKKDAELENVKAGKKDAQLEQYKHDLEVGEQAAEDIVKALEKEGVLWGKDPDKKAIMRALEGKNEAQIAALREALAAKGIDLDKMLEEQLDDEELEEAKIRLQGKPDEADIQALMLNGGRQLTGNEKTAILVLGFPSSAITLAAVGDDAIGGNRDRIQEILDRYGKPPEGSPEKMAEFAKKFEEQTGKPLSEFLRVNGMKGTAEELKVPAPEVDKGTPEEIQERAKQQAKQLLEDAKKNGKTINEPAVAASAQKLNDALNGLHLDSTRADLVREAMEACQTPEELAYLKAQYKAQYGRDLDRDLERRLTPAALVEAKATLRNDKTTVAVAKLLGAQEASLTPWTVDDQKLNDALKELTDPAERRAVLEAYKRRTGHDLAEVIAEKMTGNDRRLAEALYEGDELKARMIEYNEATGGGFFNGLHEAIEERTGLPTQIVTRAMVNAALWLPPDRTFTIGGYELGNGSIHKVDSDKMFELLEQTPNPADRERLKALYKQQTGRDLDADMEKKLVGPTGDQSKLDAYRAIMEGRTFDYYAARMDDAVSGLNDTEAFHAQLEGKPEWQRRAIIEAYCKRHGGDANAFANTVAEQFGELDQQKAHLLATVEDDAETGVAKLPDEFVLKYAQASVWNRAAKFIDENTAIFDEYPILYLTPIGTAVAQAKLASYFMRGWGVDNDAIKDVLKDKSKEEIDQLLLKYPELRKDLEYSLSGRDAFEVKLMLDEGKPTTPEARIKRALALYEFDRGSSDSWRASFSNAIVDLVSPSGKDMDARAAELREQLALLQKGGQLTAEQQAELDIALSVMDSATGSFLAAREAVTEAVATAAAAVAGAVVTVVTGGAAAPFLAALASGVATIGVKALMLGDSYGRNDIGVDLAMTAIQVATAGLGRDAQTFLAKVLSGAISNAASSFVSTAITSEDAHDLLGLLAQASKSGLVGFLAGAAGAAAQAGLEDAMKKLSVHAFGENAPLSGIFLRGFVTGGGEAVASMLVEAAASPEMLSGDWDAVFFQIARTFAEGGLENALSEMAETYRERKDAAHQDALDALRDATEAAKKKKAEGGSLAEQQAAFDEHLAKGLERAPREPAKPAQHTGDIYDISGNKVAPHGLADRQSIDRFVDRMKTVQSEWSALSVSERARSIASAINEQLKAKGIPHIDIKVVDLGPNRRGELDFVPGSIVLNRALLDRPHISTADMSTLVDTVYHEARHHEQWHLMVKHLESQGYSAKQIADMLYMGEGPVRMSLAERRPLTPEQLEAGKQYYNHIYNNDPSTGGKRAHRDDVLSRLGTDPAAYDQYRRLLEEADAWAVGGAAGEAYRNREDGPIVPHPIIAVGDDSSVTTHDPIKPDPIISVGDAQPRHADDADATKKHLPPSEPSGSDHELAPQHLPPAKPPALDAPRKRTPEEIAEIKKKVKEAREETAKRDAELVRTLHAQTVTAPDGTLYVDYVFGHITIGAGFAGIANEMSRPNRSPDDIVIGGKNPWDDATSKFGQRAGDSELPNHRPGLGMTETSSDPTARYMDAAEHAENVALNRNDHKIKTYDGHCDRIEPGPQDDWPAAMKDSGATFRIRVVGPDGNTRYFYTNRVDIAGGPGPARRLHPDVLAPDVLAKLIEAGAFAFGDQAYGVDTLGVTGDIAVIGAGAAGAWAAEATAARRDADGNRVNQVEWIGAYPKPNPERERNPERLEKLERLYEELERAKQAGDREAIQAAHDKLTKFLFEEAAGNGNLPRNREKNAAFDPDMQAENGGPISRLATASIDKITFERDPVAKRDRVKIVVRDPAGGELILWKDALVLSIGQDARGDGGPARLLENFAGQLVPIFGAPEPDGFEPVVGLQTPDGRLRVLGAAATPKDVSDLLSTAKHEGAEPMTSKQYQANLGYQAGRLGPDSRGVVQGFVLAQRTIQEANAVLAKLLALTSAEQRAAFDRPPNDEKSEE